MFEWIRWNEYCIFWNVLILKEIYLLLLLLLKKKKDKKKKESALLINTVNKGFLVGQFWFNEIIVYNEFFQLGSTLFCLYGFGFWIGN